jgi:hypothetical protein
MDENYLEKIRAAYTAAVRQPPSSEPALPTWDELPLEMREAFVAVFCAGRRDALDERGEGGVVTISKDWPPDKPLPNPYSRFSFVVVDMLTPREVERLRQEAKETRAYYPTGIRSSEAGGEEGAGLSGPKPALA